MPATDLPLLIEAARAAGDIAMSYAKGAARSWDKPGGLGPVTEADMAVNEMLEQRLRAARPDYGWLSEETEDSADRLAHERVFIIDPIDGTRSFVDGADSWAHALAIAEEGRVTAGVVYLPRRGLLYSAALGQGAYLNGAPIRPTDLAELTRAHILAAKPVLNGSHWRDETPPFHLAYRPSLAYRMALVAEGRFDGMLTIRPCWEWDIAAGDLILREAGALCTDRLGAPLRYNNPHPTQNGVIAAGGAIHAQLAQALKPA
ncbi:3'(2'),5'-bisphosphate nucleotidase CysQ [Albibacillus kandeliae]|uniref:3'(2'),5'-bisphosphate nucleotidase CysQ n=1 Tax=Albibacillus kandeliae TaxID=2174228 RepID=UPI000D68FF8C|nr:3'(2'),5'-bisphosphate nucleotidase CysQ [Albibacillus kandeliae]